VNGLCDLSASDLLAGYAAREFTPVEVVDALGARIEELNPSLGAFTELCLDRARGEARTAAGPLAGVPFAVKDLIDTEGVRTSYGSAIFADHVPGRDAAAVAALRAAGALLIGKTQTHEFAWGITTRNDAMGSTFNPWDVTRVPGGSSGGSGAALAARLVPLALGSDTGGSIRIPAGFCGVTGLKPTFGRLDATGVWPLAPSLDHVGPMARTPEDLELAFAALEGRAVARASRADISGATVVVCPDLHAVPLPPDRERAFADAVRSLERLGARVVERPGPDAARVNAGAFVPIQLYEAAKVHGDAGLYPARADEYGGDVGGRLGHAAALDPREYVDGVLAREAARAAFGRLLADGAVLMSPTSAIGPLPVESTLDQNRAFRDAVMPYTSPQNVAGVPSCAVRAGFDDDGLPIGVQFTAGAWRDGDALAVARAFFAATPDVQSRWP
jgi:aspartyl-tRNA(Asn)/glutamyl-tRNA(Gln) amidotransferase subunit A